MKLAILTCSVVILLHLEMALGAVVYKRTNKDLVVRRHHHKHHATEAKKVSENFEALCKKVHLIDSLM